jgi:L-Ala-D/L-Glu epimerase
MTLPTTVVRLAAEPLDIPLRKPFGIAGGAQDVARNVLVTVELASGVLGFGEAAPFPAFNGETQAAALAAVEAARPAVLGADVRAWGSIAESVRGAVGSARCAIETAVLDALARQAGLPLWALFGGASTSLSTDVTVTTGSAADARTEATAAAAQGFEVIKLKVGGGPLGLDVHRASAVHAAAPRCALTLDANGSFTVEAARALLAALAARSIPVALFEQPVARDDWAGLRELTASAGVPIAADESVSSAADVLRVANERAAHVVNLKLMKSGIREALDMAAVARAAGLRLMVGGMVESVLAMTTSACFAAGLGGFSFVDLDTPLFLAENPFQGGFTQTGPHLDLRGLGSGHGTNPRP